MATAYITEYNTIGVQNGNSIPVAQEPAVTDQAIMFTTATQSDAFNDNTKYVRIVSDTAFHASFGTNPTATASTQYCPANIEIWRMVSPGHKAPGTWL